MKRYFICSILLALTSFGQAQNAPVRTSRGAERNVQQPAATNNAALSDLTIRARMMNDHLTQEIGNARWVRNILRELDLTKEKNAPLYYPVQEMNGMKNLFTSLFQLASEGKIKIYKYRVDYESFEDDNILTFKDLLDNFNIYYEEIPSGSGRPPRYVVNSSDIPSREASKLYVKEAWYFDQNNSICDVKTLAICPLAYITIETGEELLQAVFWVKYEDIRPYIKNNFIMTSSINNAKTYTMDDFFRRRLYDGDIIQTENLLNQPLAMLFETEEELAAEQQRIEGQLKAFNDSLWVPVDTSAVVSKKGAKKTTRDASTNKAAYREKVAKEKPAKQPKAPPAEKAASTKSAPTRSIRR
jgi:gliding motility associated protien GldN